jgi:plastocyanin
MRFNRKLPVISWALSVLLFFGTAASAGAADQKPTHKIYNVLIKGFKFVPDKLEVNAGDVILWRNEDIVPHIVTADKFKSRNLDHGESWSYTAKQKGDFPYNCHYHPTMRAELIVH